MPDSSGQPFRPGTVWSAEREKLYRFTTQEALVIRPWPLSQAWRKRAGQGWKPAAPLIDVSMADHGTNRHERLAWSQVPPAVRDAVCHASFAGFQWPTLSMIARCPGALNLAQREPMMAAMLAIGNRVRPVATSWLFRSVRTLLDGSLDWKRMQRIHDWLGLDTSRSFLRLTRKANIAQQSWRWRHWSLILKFWNVPRGRKLLQHLPVVTTEHAEFMESLLRMGTVERVAEMIHPNLLHEIHEQGVYGGASWIAHDLCSVWPLVWTERPVPLIRNLDHLERLRTEVNLAYELANRHELGAEHMRRQAVLDALNQGTPAEALFPPIPLHGTATIQPLPTPQALVHEGASMGHCLNNDHWTMSACMALGYAYHVDFEGERATVWVARVRDNPLGFHIEQIQGPSNQNPSEQLIEHVMQWLKLHEQWALFRLGQAVRPSGEAPPALAEVWTKPLPPQVGGGPFADDEIPF